MIKLTEQQVDALISHGYKNYYYFKEKPETKMLDNPWYKQFVIDIYNEIVFEVIINPVGMSEDVVIGVSSDDSVEGSLDYHYNAKEIFEEIMFLKSIGVM